MLPTFTFSGQLLKYPVEKAGRLSLDLTLYKSGLKGSKSAMNWTESVIGIDIEFGYSKIPFTYVANDILPQNNSYSGQTNF
jgi:hypothetical protein